MSLRSGSPPETDIPDGSPTLDITGTKIVSSGIGLQDWHGRTAVQVLTGGIVVLVYRVGSAHPVNDNGELHIRFSNDYGANWTDANKFLDGSSVTNFPWRPSVYPSYQGPGEPWILQAPNGDILVFGWRIDYGVEGGGTYMSRSTDGGKTFNEGQKITVNSLPGDCSQDSNYMTNDHFILNNVIYISCWNNDGLGSISTLIKSEDNGATWDFVSKITDNDIDTDIANYEAGLCYVGNNKIITMMRNGSNNGTLYKISTDMGQTWGALSDVTSWGVTARHRFQQRSRLKQKSNWWLDPVIITAIFTHPTPGSSQPRRNGIQISKDFGVTFPYVLNLDIAYEDGGYNDLFYNPITDEYVCMAYRGLLTDADIVQYNFKIIWS